MANYIQKHISLIDNKVLINGEEVFSVDKNEDFITFVKSVYKNYAIKYGKFYKMDALSKLGFLATELLLKDVDRGDILPEETAIICANKSSSLHTDAKYQNTLAEIPSPAVFVYTLPNIVLGEICIRNMIRGESLFLIQDSFDREFICDYVNDILDNTNTRMSITGWIEIDRNEEYRVELYLVSNSKTKKEFIASQLVQ